MTNTVTTQDVITANKKLVLNFNVLIDCVEASKDYADFVASYGDELADFFKFGTNKKGEAIRTNKKSHEKIYAILKGFKHIETQKEIFTDKESGEKFIVGVRPEYKNEKIEISKFLLCKIDEAKEPAKKSAFDILKTASLRESMWQLRATDAQIKFLASLCKGESGNEFLKDAENSNFKLTKKEASFAIENLKG